MQMSRMVQQALSSRAVPTGMQLQRGTPGSSQAPQPGQQLMRMLAQRPPGIAVVPPAGQLQMLLQKILILSPLLTWQQSPS